MLVHSTVLLQIHKQISLMSNILMVGVTDIILEPLGYEQSLHQQITRPAHILDGFSAGVGVELPIHGCTLMVVVHVGPQVQVIVNLHYDG